MDFEKHETSIVWESIRRDGGCCEGNAAEGLDGIGVQLGMSQMLSRFKGVNKMTVFACTYLCDLHICFVASRISVLCVYYQIPLDCTVYRAGGTKESRARP